MGLQSGVSGVASGGDGQGNLFEGAFSGIESVSREGVPRTNDSGRRDKKEGSQEDADYVEGVFGGKVHYWRLVD